MWSVMAEWRTVAVTGGSNRRISRCSVMYKSQYCHPPQNQSGQKAESARKQRQGTEARPARDCRVRPSPPQAPCALPRATRSSTWSGSRASERAQTKSKSSPSRSSRVPQAGKSVRVRARDESGKFSLEMERGDVTLSGIFLTHRELTAQFFLGHPRFAFALSRFDCIANANQEGVRRTRRVDVTWRTHAAAQSSPFHLGRCQPRPSQPRRQSCTR